MILKVHFRTVVLLGISVVISHSAHSFNNKKMPEVEKFNRCYNRFVNMPLQTTGNTLGAKLYTQVASGNKNGTTACLELLDSAQLNASGGLKAPDSQEARLIIQNFHNFHNSFFKANALNFSSAYNNMTILVRDLDEPSLYYTQALFGGKNLSNAVTSNETLKSIRTSSTTKTNYASRNIQSLHFSSYATYNASNKDLPLLQVREYDTTAQNSKDTYVRNIMTELFRDQLAAATAENDTTKINSIKTSINNGINRYKVGKSYILDDSHIVGQGELIGIAKRSPLIVPIPPINSSGGVALNTDGFISHDLFSHAGGGILGSQMYMMKNSNLGANVPTGGAGTDPFSTVPRRFTSRIYEDLLCHVLPTLSAADAAPEVDLASSHGFKQASSCMRCHSSFDPLAGVYRNTVISISGAAYNNNDIENGPAKSYGSPILTLAKLVPKAAVPATAPYAFQGTSGRLFYRDHTGALVKRSLSSIAELGQAIADSDDFYRCVAKRYYHFMTGVDVNLYAADTDLDDTGKKHKNLVFQMGRILKGTTYANNTEKTTYANYKQSLRLLVKFILDSESFSRRDLGLTGE